jgi:hypothetical protein
VISSNRVCNPIKSLHVECDITYSTCLIARVIAGIERLPTTEVEPNKTAIGMIVVKLFDVSA